jgi:Lon protease-like protein
VAAAVPFDVIEKQVLLEAETVADRCDLLVALLELAAADTQSGGGMQ